jgi:uncharacterized protein YdhG (YjbR/CyaY superfamily)
VKPSASIATSIDEYIAGCPAEVQARLSKLRATIRRAAPDAVEKISYRIPTYALNGNLVHFATFKNHIGFYPGPTGIARFSEELAPYASAKGSVQFPLDEPLPLALVARIVKFRVEESTRAKPARKSAKAATRKPSAR